jgi:predicted nucleotide-binding protein (sugar kinase/HSP70/actin superfamily)
LFGGFTWKHEDLIRAVFQGCGYRCEKLPVPNVAAFQTGKEFGNNGQCNPTYFTVGNLVQYLQFLEKEGSVASKILNNFVFFTAGSCGPCRFGMYEAEYRFALKNAGFDGFRVLLFKDSDGIKGGVGRARPEIHNRLRLRDVECHASRRCDQRHDLPDPSLRSEQGRNRSRVPGDGRRLCDDLRNPRFVRNREERSPNWLKPKFKSNKVLRNTFNVLGKMHEHLWGKDYLDALHTARERMNRIEVDRTKVKPVVKITGEFWAQITEGDGNFHMFDFLEREGAQVMVEPIATWVACI